LNATDVHWCVKLKAKSKPPSLMRMHSYTPLKNKAEAMKIRADAEAYAVNAVAKAISSGG